MYLRERARGFRVLIECVHVCMGSVDMLQKAGNIVWVLFGIEGCWAFV